MTDGFLLLLLIQSLILELQIPASSEFACKHHFMGDKTEPGRGDNVCYKLGNRFWESRGYGLGVTTLLCMQRIRLSC